MLDLELVRVVSLLEEDGLLTRFSNRRLHNLDIQGVLNSVAEKRGHLRSTQLTRPESTFLATVVLFVLQKALQSLSNNEFARLREEDLARLLTTLKHSQTRIRQLSLPDETRLL